jgi:ribonucleotide reductase alpha subunit
MLVVKRNGKSETVQFDKITDRIKKLVQPNELKYINPFLIAQKTVASIYSGISTKELDLEAANICVNLCTTHHFYSNLAGRILASNLKKETLNNFVDKERHIQKELKFLDQDWLTWITENKKLINAMIDYERDYNYDYFGFKTLERAYLLKIKNNIIERPQDMFMRVASFINKGDLDMTKKTYDLTSMGYYTHATPTLFNAGNVKSQCSSCFEGNTLVNTLRGPIAIKDVQIGDEVITHLGNIKKVVQVHQNLLGDRTLYKLYIHKTNDITVTEDHKLYIYNKISNDVCWKEVKDLTDDDYVMIPNYQGAYNENEMEDYIINEDFAKFIGIWLANGSIIEGNPLYEDNKKIQGISIHISNEKMFDFCLNIQNHLDVSDLYFDKDKTHIVFISNKLGEFFNKLFYRDDKKILADAFYRFDKKILVSLLSGLITSLGKITNNEIKLEIKNSLLIEHLYCLCRLHNLIIYKESFHVLNLSSLWNEFTTIWNNKIETDIIVFKNNTFLKFDYKLNDKYSPKVVYVYTLGIEDDHSYSIAGIIAQNCFLMGTDDSMHGITKTWADVSQISKWGGGIGLHISNIRSTGAIIKGTNGPSSGIIPMLRVYNEIARYVDQCFVGDTLIYTENNLVPIEQIKIGDKVFSQDGKLYNVDKVYSDVYDGIFIKLYFQNQYVKVTKNHPFYKINGEWCDADELTIGDEIHFSIPNHINDNANIDESDCYMYAIFLVSGYNLKNDQLYVLINCNEKINEFINNYLGWNGIDFNMEEKSNTSTYSWEVTSKFRFSRSQFYDTNLDVKNFDNNLLHLPFNKYKWFIKGIFETCSKKLGDEYFIKINENIINSLSFLLLKIGIICRQTTGTLVIYSNSILENILENNTNEIKIPDFIPIKIDKIEKVNDKCIVYDLEVNTSHTYLSQLGIVHNGGKRKGSIAIYLEPHHPDIMAFLDLRKNSGVESERTRDLNLAMWLSDLFMQQVENDGDWYLMDPDECKGLNEVYGEEYEAKYNTFVKENKFRKIIKARTIMEAILDSQIETGQPYITFKDHVNRKSNQKNIGIIKSSNLCNEIVEYSSHDEYAVCNLASIAINKCVIPFVSEKEWTIYTKENCKYCKWAKSYLHNNFTNINEKEVSFDELFEITKNKTFPQIYYGDILVGGFDEMYKYIGGKFDYEKLYEVAYVAAINLDKVIDVNFYPVIEAKKSNIRHRPIGLGIQGLADTLALLKIPFDSDECLEFNAKFMEIIYLAALTASKDISKSRWIGMKKLKKSGIVFPDYYDKNFNDFNNNEELKQIYNTVKPCMFELRNKISSWYGAYSTFEGSPISQGIFQFDMWNVKPSLPEKWEELRNEIKIHGVRNSLVTALMPTATTSQILGNNECFEPFTSNIYTRRTLAGDFPLVNKYLIDDLVKINLWSTDMKELILANNGSIANFNIIPDSIKRLYQTSWEIKQVWILKNSIARGPYNDQTASMNIYMATPNYKNLISSHMYAWKAGLKTGIYYLRSKPASGASKFTLDGKINDRLKLVTQLEEEGCLNCSA